MADSAAPGAALLAQWRRLSTLPGGRVLFSVLLGRRVPYTGTIGPRVVELRPGFAVVEMRDRRTVRNHLRSVHAIALANLGEVTSGLAMLTALPPRVRGIVTGMSVEFLKKARGRLRAESSVTLPAEITGARAIVVTAVIRDESEGVVARVTVEWRVAPAADGETRPRKGEPAVTATGAR